jgi:hypothetical protein
MITPLRFYHVSICTFGNKYVTPRPGLMSPKSTSDFITKSVKKLLLKSLETNLERKSVDITFSILKKKKKYNVQY